MISNIVDKRTNPYNVLCDVSFHPSSDFNDRPDSTQFKTYRNNIVYRQKFSISLTEAINLASEMDYPITIVLYDVDVLATRTLK